MIDTVLTLKKKLLCLNTLNAFLLFQEQSAVHSDMENELLVGQETFEECHSSASAFAILKVSTFKIA